MSFFTGSAATVGAMFSGRGWPAANERIDEMLANDPRPTTTGFRNEFRTAGRYKDGSVSETSQLEATAVNMRRRFGTGAFRSFRQQIFDTANQVGVDERAAEARQEAREAADRSADQFRRQTASLGLTARQTAAAGARMSLNRAVAEASGGSAVRRTASNTARQAMSAAPSLEDMLLQQDFSATANLGNAQVQGRIRRAQEKAANKAARNASIAQGVGMVLSIAAIAASSEKWKDKEEKNPALLDKLKKLRIDKWKYKGDDENHIGPYAEEFNETFGTEGAAGDKQFINLMDAVGVALGSIKQLDEKVEALANG